MPKHAVVDGGGLIPPSELATGTPDGTKFLRDDNVWAVPAGGGGGGGSPNLDGGTATSTYGGITPIDGGGA